MLDRSAALTLVDGFWIHPDAGRARCLAGRAPGLTRAEVERIFLAPNLLDRGDALLPLAGTCTLEWLFPRRCRVCDADHRSLARLLMSLARAIPAHAPEDGDDAGPPGPSEVRRALEGLGTKPHKVAARIARDGRQRGQSARDVYFAQLAFVQGYRLRIEANPRLRAQIRAPFPFPAQAEPAGAAPTPTTTAEERPIP